MDEPVTSTATSTPSAPSPPTSPVTSAPPSVQSTTDRPSFGEALDLSNKVLIAEGKRPYGQKVAPPSQESPTTQADGTTESTQSPPARPGFLSTDDHIKAVENARAKTRAEIEQEYRTTYGDPERVRQATTWFNNAAQDRIGFLQGVIQEALADPELAPQIASLAGRTLGGHRAPSGATDQPPAPDFTDGQGNQFYSAKTQQARDEWFKAQITRDILSQVQPDLEQVRAERAQREADQTRAQVNQTMTGYLTQARKWPQFTAHEAAIKAALLQAPPTSGHPAEEALLLREVYDRIVGPTLSRLEQDKVVASLKERAHASSLNPAATGAPSGIPKNARAKDGGSMAHALEWAAAQQAGRP